MKTKVTFQSTLAVCFAGGFLIFDGTACSVDRSGVENYSVAPSSYGILAEKSLDLMAGLDVETWATMLSDSVVFHFPDGDESTCTRLIGKKAFMIWWKNYIEGSGLKSMSIENGTYMPVNIENPIRPGDLPGTQVIAYFSNRMIYKNGTESVKMNFIIHFDKNKLIDGYYTYYDPGPMSRRQHEKFPGEQPSSI